MNTRLLFTAAALPADQARAIVAVICGTRSTRFERTRARMQKHFQNSFERVLKFAKHETLRRAARYLHAMRPLKGQDAGDQPDHPDSVRLVFNPDEWKQDLATMLATDAPNTLNVAADDTLASLGFRDPWKMPAQSVLDFIASRQNLLADVPDEIFEEIRKEISAGLNAGEGTRDLSARIAAAFDQISAQRAELIAENETSAAYQYAGNVAAKAAGVKYKKWLHSVIPKQPRPDHLEIDGLVVPFDEPYPVGDPQLMYPHMAGGAAKDVINCRCISVPATEEDYKNQ